MFAAVSFLFSPVFQIWKDFSASSSTKSMNSYHIPSRDQKRTSAVRVPFSDLQTSMMVLHKTGLYCAEPEPISQALYSLLSLIHI